MDSIISEFERKYNSSPLVVLDIRRIPSSLRVTSYDPIEGFNSSRRSTFGSNATCKRAFGLLRRMKCERTQRGVRALFNPEVGDNMYDAKDYEKYTYHVYKPCSEERELDPERSFNCSFAKPVPRPVTTPDM
jgi:hypothetical protein